MKLFWMLFVILSLFCVNISAKEISKQDLDKMTSDANKGDAKAQRKLGLKYYRTKEHAKSIEWLYKSAEQGDIIGQLWLGHAYYLGPDKHKNLKEAKKWYEKAASQGNEKARRYVKAISERKSESTQEIEAILFLLLLFPIWWLVVGHISNYSSKPIGVIVTVIFVGGVIGFMIAFSCNGGVGGSSQMSGAAWGCLFPYLLIYYTLLAFLTFSKKLDTKKKS